MANLASGLAGTLILGDGTTGDLGDIYLVVSAAPIPNDVTMTTDDAGGSTSFNTAGHWDSAAAPKSGYDYFTSSYILRTPENSGSYTFAGSSLSIDSGGYLRLKGTSDVTYTIYDLLLNGGTVDHGVDNRTYTLAGHITAVAGTTSTFDTAAFGRTIKIAAPIGGSGNIDFDDTGSNGGRVILGVPNTFSGMASIVDDCYLRLSDANALSSATLDVQGYSVRLEFDNAVSSDEFYVGGLAGSSDLTLQNITDNDPITLHVGANNADTVFSANLLGPGSLVKDGTGILELSESSTDHTYNNLMLNDGTIAIKKSTGLGTGTVTINGGTIRGDGSTRAPANAVIQSGDVTLGVSGSADLDFTGTGGGWTITGGDRTITVDGITATIQSAIGEDVAGRALTKAGDGTLTLSGPNSFTGNLNVNAGTVLIANGDAGGATEVVVAGGATLGLRTSGGLSIPVTVSGASANATMDSDQASAGFYGDISGSVDQTLTISGAGGQAVNFSQQSSKQLQNFYGTVSVSSGATMGFRSTALNQGSDNATFDLTGNIGTRNNGSLALGALTGTGNVNMGGSGSVNEKLSLTVGANDTSTTYDGVINDADVANGKIVALTKTGDGTLTLTAVQNYTGDTAINAGTLALSGSGSLASSSISIAAGATFDVSGVSFSLGSGQTLGGNGSVAGNVGVASGGIVAPGASVGALAVGGNLVFQSGASYIAEVDASTSDTMNVSGNVTITDGAVLDLQNMQGTQRVIVSCDGSISGEFRDTSGNLLENGTELHLVSGYWIHYVTIDSKSYVIISNSSSTPTSSGVDLRAYHAADGVYVEFVAYDVEADGTIMLALVGEDGEIVWSGSVEVTAGPQSVARFLVPGLEPGQAYNFLVRDEVGQWWEADGVTVASFASDLTEMTLTGLTITFDSLPEREYDIQWSAALGGTWQTVTGVTAVAEQTSVVVEYPAGGEAIGFFRVEAR